jgi:two-component system, NarL family, sensor kinase
MLQKLFCSFLLFFTIHSYAQVVNKFDSIEKVINTMPDDTAKANKLNSLVQKLQFPNPEKAAALAEKSIALNEKINYPMGLANAYKIRGILYFNQSIFDSSKIFIDKAWNVVKNGTDKKYLKQQGIILSNYATLYSAKGQMDSAVAKYLAAIKIYEKLGEEEMNFNPYNNLSVSYVEMNEKEKGLQYGIKAYELAIKMNDSTKQVWALNNIVSAKLQLKMYDNVILDLQKNLTISNALENYSNIGATCDLFAQYYNEKEKNYDAAISYYKQAIDAEIKDGNEYDLAKTYQNIGSVFVLKKDFANANKYLDLALSLAKKLEVLDIQKYATETLIANEEAQGNYKAALAYTKQNIAIVDTLNKIHNKDKVLELETKYETEKKETQLKLQQSTIKQKSTLNILFGSIAAAILGLSLFGFKNYKNKQTLQQQKIAELETQQQLTATEAVLKGEEQERTRLAKDLHDGLGGMLSGIKYSFNTMKGNMIMTPDNAQAFERSMDMLDSSIKEMRRVAHNMMPEALVKFGLDTALKDFCNEIQKSGALQISYQSIGLQNEVIDQTVGITVYRIVQELINNTMKHAMAKTAIVQVTKSNNQLSVTVEDDGKGFDTAIINNPVGMGWSNITNRVEFLKGKLDVDSQHGKGTSVHIEINV